MSTTAKTARTAIQCRYDTMLQPTDRLYNAQGIRYDRRHASRRRVGSMAFYIGHVSGRSKAKRARVDPDAFETYEMAESMARARWPGQSYFIVEADDEMAAGRQAIRESEPLDERIP